MCDLMMKSITLYLTQEVSNFNTKSLLCLEENPSSTVDVYSVNIMLQSTKGTMIAFGSDAWKRHTVKELVAMLVNACQINPSDEQGGVCDVAKGADLTGSPPNTGPRYTKSLLSGFEGVGQRSDKEAQ